MPRSLSCLFVALAMLGGCVVQALTLISQPILYIPWDYSVEAAYVNMPPNPAPAETIIFRGGKPEVMPDITVTTPAAEVLESVGRAQFDLQLSQSLPVDMWLAFDLSGTAESSFRVIGSSSTRVWIYFPAGSTMQSQHLYIYNDSVDEEEAETIVLTVAAQPSATATITLLPTHKPIITQGPESAILQGASTHVLRVVADTRGQAAQYRWYQDGNVLPDAKEAELVITRAPILGSYHQTSSYTVEVITAHGAVSETAYVMTIPALQGGPRVATLGQGADLSINGFQPYLYFTPGNIICACTIGIIWDPSRPTVSFQWYKDGVLLPGEVQWQLQRTLSQTQLADEGSYSCELTLQRPIWFFPMVGGSPVTKKVITFDLKLLDPTEPPVITSVELKTGLIGQSYNGRVMTTGHAPRLRGKGLPPGLKLDAATGIISGVPTRAGNFKVEITPYNVAGAGLASSVVLQIQALPAQVVGSYVGCLQGAESQDVGYGLWQKEKGMVEFTLSAAGAVTGKYTNSQGTKVWSGIIEGLSSDGAISLGVSESVLSPQVSQGNVIRLLGPSLQLRIAPDGSSFLARVPLNLYYAHTTLVISGSMLPPPEPVYEEVGRGVKKSAQKPVALNLLVEPGQLPDITTTEYTGKPTLWELGYDYARLSVGADGSVTAVGRPSYHRAYTLRTVMGADGSVPYAHRSPEGGLRLGILVPEKGLALSGVLEVAESDSKLPARKALANPPPTTLPALLQLTLGHKVAYPPVSMTFTPGARGMALPVGGNPERVWLTYSASTGEFSFGLQAAGQRRSSGLGLLTTDADGQLLGGGRYQLPTGVPMPARLRAAVR